MEYTKIQIVEEPEDKEKYRLNFGKVRDKAKKDDVLWTKQYHNISRWKNMVSPFVIKKEDSSDISLLKSMNIWVEDDTLNQKQCNELIKLVNTRKRNTSNDEWNDRCLWLDNWDGIENFVGKDLTNKLEKFWKCKLKPNDRHIVYWGKGMSMPPHRDKDDFVKGSSQFDDRDITSITYLNENFQGGTTKFPQLDLEIVPSTGSTVSFMGGTVPHEVTEILQGSRYTIVQWYKIL